MRAGGAAASAAREGAPAKREPEPPWPAVRGERWLRRVDAGLAWGDGWLGRWLPADFNLLAQAGAAANVALLVAVASGVLMLIWYSPSLQFAYSSLATVEGRTLGGGMRALHRYSSDLTMLLVLVHAGRVFFARKFGGARWLAWISGVGMLATIWFIGWTGYWLVWDQPAQQVAVTSMRLLDALPIFGEPMGRLYVSDRTVPSLLFFVIFFLHMLLPLAIAVGLAVHLARLSRARLLPRWEMAVAIVGALVVASVVVPAPLDARAEMTRVAEAFTVDAWYLSPLALGLRFQSGGLWVALFGAVALGGLVPWLLGRRRPAASYQAAVAPERCHACTQCSQDCPFDAIRMVARTDGKRFASQAWVDPARCVGCGVCGGSCDSGGISLTWFDTRREEARIEQVVAAAGSNGKRPAVVLVAAEIASPLPGLPDCVVCRVPTASWVRSSLVERLCALGARAVFVVRDARVEAWARDGGRWVEARLAGERAPQIRFPCDGAEAWRVVDFDPARPDRLVELVRKWRVETAGGAPGRHRGRRVAGGVALALLVTAATVAPSRLRVANPASPEPELVISLKAFGNLLPAAGVDAAADAAKPVHMRGRVSEKPRRAPVVVRLTIDGVEERRVFAAKGVSHDGPALGEWHRRWSSGEHRVEVVIGSDEARSPARWEGVLRAQLRRRQVIAYDPSAGFLIE